MPSPGISPSSVGQVANLSRVPDKLAACPTDLRPREGIGTMAGRWPGRPAAWTLCFVLMGLGLRSVHYLREPSVWHDEAALILNVIGKSFGELLGPLFFAEAAPPLFLWVERAVCLVLGDGVGALRLLPFLASCAALVLLVP